MCDVAGPTPPETGRVRAVAFDLGGVLFRDGKAVAVPRIAQAFGRTEAAVLASLTSPLSNAVRRGEVPEAELWDAVQRELGLERGDEDVARLREMWYEGYELDQTMRDVILALRTAGTKTVAFTGNIPSRIAWLERRYGFEQLFDARVYSYDHRASKTMPRFHEAMLAAAGCPPSAVLFVDDEERHLKVAQALGIHTHLHTTGATDALVARLRELGALPQCSKL